MIESPSQTILHLASAINQLAEARERFRVASMANAKTDCEVIAARLLTDLQTFMGISLG